MQTVLLDALVALLSAYLALSGALAHAIQHLILPEAPRASLHGESGVVGGTFPRALTLLPSDYGADRSVLRTLRDSLTYQQATVATALDTLPSPHTAEEAMVNIVCTRAVGEDTRTLSGSGVFIHPKGVILTNAHVAQFLLLETKGEASCIIRTGSPAEDRFKAEVLHISPLWLHAHLAQINDPEQEGTGERDYALLYVSEAVEGDVPDTFPFLSLERTALGIQDHGRSVRALGYPAVSPHHLSLASGETEITELFTFGDRTADVMAIASSSAGARGSSGGAIVSTDNTMLGLIVTQGDTASGPRTLRALSLSYIDASIREETGFDLPTLLTSDVQERSRAFTRAITPLLAALQE